VAGEDQHYIPAAYIGRFSADREGRHRDRVVWVQRAEGRPYQAAARYVGKRPKQYDHDRQLFWRPGTKAVDAAGSGSTLTLDTIWRYESRLTSALNALEDPTGLLDGCLWAQVLVPFVSSLFVRGPDFATEFQARIPGATGPAPDSPEPVPGSLSWRDNSLAGMAIEWQRLLAPVMAAQWTVFHGPSPILTTNDLGRCLMFGLKPDVISYAVPLSPRSVLALTRRACREMLEWREDRWIAPISRRSAPDWGLEEGRRAIRAFAYHEVYGPTEESVRDASEDWRPSRPYVGPWGGLITGPGRGLLPYLEDYFRLLTIVDRTHARVIAGGDGIDWGIVARSWSAPVQIPLNVGRFPGGLFVTDRGVGINLERFGVADVEREIEDKQAAYEATHPGNDTPPQTPSAS